MQQRKPSEDLHNGNDIGFDQSDSNMDPEQQELFLNIRKSNSNGSFLGRFFGNQEEKVNKCLVLEPKQMESHQISDSKQNKEPRRIFKKIKKEKKHNACDYEKNICGYITKKIIRQFISKEYEERVKGLCRSANTQHHKCRAYYLSHIEHITGPSHIPALLHFMQGDTTQTHKIKIVFREFFQWFLKERYLRYLLIEGKMKDKNAYIEYKNKYLVGLVQNQIKKINPVPVIIQLPTVSKESSGEPLEFDICKKVDSQEIIKLEYLEEPPGKIEEQ